MPIDLPWLCPGELSGQQSSLGQGWGPQYYYSIAAREAGMHSARAAMGSGIRLGALQPQFRCQHPRREACASNVVDAVALCLRLCHEMGPTPE